MNRTTKLGRKSGLDLWNRVLGGKLDELISGYRADGLSYNQIAHRLYAEHDIDVTPQTIRRWDAILTEQGAGK